MTAWVTTGTWDDAPHLTEEMKAQFLEKVEPHLREVRTKGMPTFGAGLVWPVDIESIIIPPFSIPNEYYRGYGLDTGWSWNTVLWYAEDRQNEVIYITDVFKRKQCEPPIVAEAIKSRGKWMAGVADAADVNRLDGRQYMEIYRGLGLDVELPNKAKETGINVTWHKLTTGKIRIFNTCTPLMDEMRVYMRDPKSPVGAVKEGQDDHCCDILRYLALGGTRRGKQTPKTQLPSMDWNSRPGGNYGWMA